MDCQSSPTTIILEEQCFYNAEFSEVRLPDTLKEIRNSAFYACYNLETLDIPDSVEKIGYTAFGYCYIVSIELGAGVKELSEYAFAGCFRLVEVYNRSGVDVEETVSSAIGYMGKISNIYTESDGSKLTTDENGFVLYRDGDVSRLVDYVGELTAELTIPEGVTEIGNWAFVTEKFRKTLKTGIFPDSVVKIGERAFYGSASLKNIRIPNSVTELSEAAFHNCSGIESVEIGDGVSSLLAFDFPSYKKLCSVKLGSGITEIPAEAFSYCSSLSEI